MTDKQLLALYRAACGGAGRKEDPNASDAWKRALLGYPHAEAKAALEAWWLQTAPAQGSLIDRPRGSRDAHAGRSARADTGSQG